MKDKSLLENARSEVSMGHLSRITSTKDLPSDKKLTAYIREAMALNDAGIKMPPRPKAEKKELVVPDDLKKALSKNKKASQVFEAFSYSHRKEYINWINEAKREETRAKRVNSAMDMLAEGKHKDWRYETKK